VRRLFSGLIVIAAIASSMAIAPRDAHAFVSPGWRTLSIHRGIVGTWQLIQVRGESMSLAPEAKSLVLEIGATTIRATFEDKTKELLYESVVDEDGMLALTAYNDSGDRIEADVLIETADAMTIYLKENDDDIGIALHFERIK
jgi:hypothetical protein